jgi:diaminopimelate epimerase
MKISFIKMHGTGNDFVVIDGRKRSVRISKKLVQRLCHRRFGIGADQILVIASSRRADVQMRIFNADGSEVEHCGNGIRCLARYVAEGENSKKTLSVETLSGISVVKLLEDKVRVDMGVPRFEAKEIPVQTQGRVIARPFTQDGFQMEMTCVSMGNPHCVIPVEAVEPFPVEAVGSQIENDPFFPNRTNVEFAEFVSRDRIKMRVWERGSGETWACGTGACAVAVAGVLLKKTGRKVQMDLKGGALEIYWDPKTNHVFLTGPAEEVYRGEIVV